MNRTIKGVAYLNEVNWWQLLLHASNQFMVTAAFTIAQYVVVDYHKHLLNVVMPHVKGFAESII